jgi:hypothetical protein
MPKNSTTIDTLVGTPRFCIQLSGVAEAIAKKAARSRGLRIDETSFMAARTTTKAAAPINQYHAFGRDLLAVGIDSSTIIVR